MNKIIPIIEQHGLREEGIITAKEMLEDVNKLPPNIDTAVVLFDNKPDEHLLCDAVAFFDFVGASSVLKQYIYKNKIILSYAPLGGPAAGGLIEELIALGVKRFIAVGSSGYIGDEDGDYFLLVDKAIRDEGLSYHYLEGDLYINTNNELNHVIEMEFINRNLPYKKGITWTTDAFYRETPSRTRIRKEQGAVCVEMECASMASVCQYHNVMFSQILYFSDLVHHSGWSGFKDNRTALKNEIQKIIVDIACTI